MSCDLIREVYSLFNFGGDWNWLTEDMLNNTKHFICFTMHIASHDDKAAAGQYTNNNIHAGL